MKEKRKKRSKLIKDRAGDLLKIPILHLGSEDDPCFGKFYKPTCKECKNCGDNEFCAIAMGQNNHTKRLDVEKKQPFLDMEESEIPKPKKKELRQQVRSKTLELIKFHRTKGITKKELDKLLYDEFFNFGFTQEKITKLSLQAINKAGNSITFKKDKYYAKGV